MPIDFSDPTPLYKQIAVHIKKEIASGTFKVGEKIPSQRELAEQYDVSMITVKKAISDLINEEILYSRVGKGTFVARKTKRSNLSDVGSIGLVLSDLKSPYFSLITHGVEDEVSNQDYNLLISNTSGEFEEEERQIRRSMEMGVDGMVIASMSHEYKANGRIRKIHREGYPYVVVSYIEDTDIYHVGTDHEAGAYIATSHLIEHGYREIGYLCAEEGNLLGEVRRRGYEQAMQDHNLEVREEYIYCFPYSGEWKDEDSGYSIGEQMIENGRLPEAMFIYNDLGALGFQRAMLEANVQIPEDIAIIGFDDIERSAYCSVPLTTIRQPTERIGQLAVKKVIDQINGKNPEIRTILKPELVIRDSCGEKPAISEGKAKSAYEDHPS